MCYYLAHNVCLHFRFFILELNKSSVSIQSEEHLSQIVQTSYLHFSCIFIRTEARINLNSYYFFIVASMFADDRLLRHCYGPIKILLDLEPTLWRFQDRPASLLTIFIWMMKGWAHDLFDIHIRNNSEFWIYFVHFRCIDVVLIFKIRQLEIIESI